MKNILFILLLISSFVKAQVGSPFLKHYFNVQFYGAVGDGVTDDGPAIKRAVAAARAVKGLGEIYFPLTPSNIYQVNSPIDSTYGGYDCNCQIPIPVDSGDGNRARIIFRGESGPNMSITGGVSVGTPAFSGVIIRSGYTGNRSTRVKGTAIIGTSGPNIGGVGNGENLNYLTVENIAFIAKNNPNGAGPEIGGVNYRHGASVQLRYCTYSVDTAGSIMVIPSREISGFETSDCDNEADNTINNCLSIGAKYGYIIGEHTSGDQLSAYLCWNVIGVKWGNHASSLGRVLGQWIVNGITYVDQGSNCQTSPLAAINIGLFDIEGSASCYAGKWFNISYCVNDSLNRITGNVRYWMSNCGVGGNGSASWNSNGGSNFKQSQLGTAPSASGTLAGVLASGNSADAAQQLWLKYYAPTNYAERIGGFNVQPMSIDNTALLWNAHFNGSLWVRDSVGTAAMIQWGSGVMYYRTAPTGAAGSTITWTFPHVIQSNNNSSFSNISNSPTDYGTGLVQAASITGAQFSAIYDATHHTEITTNSSGNGTIAPTGGQLNLTATTNPTTTSTYDLGNTSFSWRNLYTNHLVTGSTGGTWGAGSIGTGGTNASTGGDLSGIIDFTTGTGPGANATMMTVTFGSSFAFPAGCRVVITPANANAAALTGATQVFIGSTATTNWTLKSGSSALAASTQYQWYYSVFGY